MIGKDVQKKIKINEHKNQNRLQGKHKENLKAKIEIAKATGKNRLPIY